ISCRSFSSDTEGNSITTPTVLYSHCDTKRYRYVGFPLDLAWKLSRLREKPYRKYTTNPASSQYAKRFHVISGRNHIKTTQETIPRIGTNGNRGTLKALGRCGSLMRRIMIPVQTRTNANKVPIFVRSTISSILTNIAQTPTATPVKIVVTCGVRNLGCTFAKDCGSSPSRAIEKKILGWPS